MKFFKKTVTFRLPLWLLLVLEIAIVLMLSIAMVMQTSIPRALQLRGLRPGMVESAQLSYFPAGQPVQTATLTQEEISAAVKLINQVQLSGKPYTMQFVGGSADSITFSLANGSVLEFGVICSADYLYCVNGEYYYICSDGFRGEGVDRYPGDLDLYAQWVLLYESLCARHFEDACDQQLNQ